MHKRMAVVNQRECVACGCCANICPKGAITIVKGLYARVDSTLCVGCGKCVRECPASVIQLEVTAREGEKTVV